MVHGASLTGMSWETTPDGREGWATYFTRNGFDTYVVDIPGRGRAGFNVLPLNQAKVESNVTLQPSLPRTGIETAWVAFRFGEAFDTPYPDTAFPCRQPAGLQRAGRSQCGSHAHASADETVPAAIAALLERTEPAILMVQAGRFADAAVALRPDLVRMMIHLESSCPELTGDQLTGYAAVPSVLYIHGDIAGNPSATGQPRLDLCVAAMNAINANVGRATLTELPAIGLKGNSHMLMQDTNNLDVANWLIREIRRRGL